MGIIKGPVCARGLLPRLRRITVPVRIFRNKPFTSTLVQLGPWRQVPLPDLIKVPICYLGIPHPEFPTVFRHMLIPDGIFAAIPIEKRATWTACMAEMPVLAGGY